MKELAVNDELKDLTEDQIRAAQTKLIMNLFDLWNLTYETRLNLLDQSPKSRTLINKYQSGQGMLPKGKDLAKRVGLMLSIHKALALLYPENENIRRTWVHRHNQQLGNYKPIDLMKEQGLFGIAKVARYLDHYRGQ